ncbi:MAG: septum formation initiator family protein [Pseudomonadota bacterium]
MRSSFLIDVAAPTLCLCWAAAMIYSAFAGDGGYRALAELNQRLALEQAELDDLSARRLTMEKRADLLNSKSLDPDLIDEKIRSVLGFSAPGDIIIPKAEFEKLMRAAEAEIAASK